MLVSVFMCVCGFLMIVVVVVSYDCCCCSIYATHITTHPSNRLMIVIVFRQFIHKIRKNKKRKEFIFRFLQSLSSLSDGDIEDIEECFIYIPKIN